MKKKIKSIFIKKEDEDIKKHIMYINYLIVISLVGIGILYAFNSLDYIYNWEDIIKEYRYKFILGFGITFLISFLSLILSIVIGLVLIYFQKSRFLPFHYFSKIFIEIVRGTPLIVQIYIFFYVIGTAMNMENRYVMGVVIMGIFSGAYVGEILRSGIESIEQKQWETSKVLGLTKYQTYRYIIFPQVVKRIMAPLTGQFANLIKDSSLLSIIAVNEFTKNVQEVDSLTFSPIENYCILAIGYLILTYPISYISKYYERKFTYGN
ncbi:amino acid ABC transporter permease [uncultured Cetobacterium sp.]|uniref:amino acid ABC transporter permease n=1 Tax=uncultured Cetobacterium sp. TaxID=527638 RepID=UPI00261A9C3B|nr:amino acid ABC transporter permease [uncultured Cetobacterium sp.]